MRTKTIYVGEVLIIDRLPTPTPTATPIPTETPVPTATLIPTETPVLAYVATPLPTPEAMGALCFQAFDDTNQDGLLDNNEKTIAGVTFELSSIYGVEQVQLKSKQLQCRTLIGGVYTITRQTQPLEQTTTLTQTVVSIPSGGQMIVTFGSVTLAQPKSPAFLSSLMVIFVGSVVAAGLSFLADRRAAARAYRW